jgi:hypothetical protein
LNSGPPAPKAGALPGCATLRYSSMPQIISFGPAAIPYLVRPGGTTFMATRSRGRRAGLLHVVRRFRDVPFVGFGLASDGTRTRNRTGNLQVLSLAPLPGWAMRASQDPAELVLSSGIEPELDGSSSHCLYHVGLQEHVAVCAVSGEAVSHGFRLGGMMAPRTGIEPVLPDRQSSGFPEAPAGQAQRSPERSGDALSGRSARYRLSIGAAVRIRTETTMILNHVPPTIWATAALRGFSKVVDAAGFEPAA